jgi:hypothetical protein
MKQKRFNFVEPQVILTVIISLIVLAVGVFAFFSVTSGIESTGVSAGGTDCFSITTPTNPETLTLPTNTISIVSVTEYYSDGTNAAIDSGNYTWDPTNPSTIDVNVTGG